MYVHTQSQMVFTLQLKLPFDVPKKMDTLPIRNSVIFTMSVQTRFQRPNYVLMDFFSRLKTPILKNGKKSNIFFVLQTFNFAIVDQYFFSLFPVIIHSMLIAVLVNLSVSIYNINNHSSQKNSGCHGCCHGQSLGILDVSKGGSRVQVGWFKRHIRVRPVYIGKDIEP